MILFGGSYTQEVGPGLEGTGKGIYCFNFNQKTGELQLLHVFLNRNTSYIAISKCKKYLYSFQEVSKDKKPVVLSFEIQENFSLKLLNQQSVAGGLPCHLSLINDTTLGVACYQTGNVHLYAIEKNGLLKPCHQTITNIGSSLNKERQECAHAHMVIENNGQVFVPDLGIDKIVVFNSLENSLIEEYKINVSLGEGPRHIVFHKSGKVAFVINELTGNVLILNKINSKYEVVKTINSIPNFFKETPSAAAIKLSSDGKFLYVSNRGCNTIAIFKFDIKTNKLELINQQLTFGDTPRDFTISPDGNWLIAANQDTNNLVVFERNNKTGLLKKINELKNINSVVCLKWM